jgi:glutamate synthase (NADPH) large chain
LLTDGRYAACCLDRNGLRPARWVITRDRHITIASEIGVYDYDPADVVSKGRLGPGQMLAVDLASGKLLHTRQIEDDLKSRHPYRRWLNQGVSYLESELVDVQTTAEPMDRETLAVHQKMFNLSVEEGNDVIRVLAEAGNEAVGSMGDDTPMPVLSRQVRSLYDYFRQQFAQVTNPPIDPLRERIVMSLQTEIGPEMNVFEPLGQHARQIVMNSPVLSQKKLAHIMDPARSGVPAATIELNYPESIPLDEALADICRRAAKAVRGGAGVVLLSDRQLEQGKLPVHALLATGAVHNHLVDEGLRCNCNLLVETGTARDPHHFACLIGYGATAVFPYLAYQVLQDMARRGVISTRQGSLQLGRTYRRGVRKGLFKIMSKMGIATIASYRAAQLFEIVGLNRRVVDLCFRGTVSRIQGTDFDDLHLDQSLLGRRAWDPGELATQGGLLKYVHGGEYHCYNPDVVATLQAAVRSGDYARYQQYAELVNQRPVAVLRDLLKLKPAGAAVAVEEVEPTRPSCRASTAPACRSARCRQRRMRRWRSR